MAKDYSVPVLDGPGDTDYARYMRTDELLSLQRDPSRMVHRDELLFQTVHQSTELWLKHATFEVREAAAQVHRGALREATALLARGSLGIQLITSQLEMLHHLSSWDFQTIRTVLGHGSGFESPGWRAVREVSREVGEAFDAHVRVVGIKLLDVYLGSTVTDIYRLAEALIEWDERISMWRVLHYKVATRIIGHDVVGTKGTPVEVLASLIGHRFFPELWRVRTELTRIGPLGDDNLGYSASGGTASEPIVDIEMSTVTGRAGALRGGPAGAPTEPPTPAAFRELFPMLARTVHLASCSLGARSAAGDAALARMQDEMSRHGAPWPLFEQELAATRTAFAELIGATADQVAVVPSASVGAYQAISTMDLSRRDAVLASTEEFPSLAHVWLAQQARGARVRFVSHAGLAPGMTDYQTLLDDRVALVSVPLVTYGSGVRLPVAAIASAAHAVGARVLVDAYQAVGVLPVDVARLGCDYLVAGTSKYLLGLPGLAFLYARDLPAGDLDPVLTGWFGRVDPFAFDPRRLDFPVAARRFETGTAAVPAVYAAHAGLGLVSRLDLAEVARHVHRLVALAAQRLTAMGERVRLAPNPADRGAHLGILDLDPGRLGAWLAARGIAASPRGPVVRASFHYYNVADDVERLCTAVHEFRSSTSSTR